MLVECTSCHAHVDAEEAGNFQYGPGPKALKCAPEYYTPRMDGIQAVEPGGRRRRRSDRHRAAAVTRARAQTGFEMSPATSA